MKKEQYSPPETDIDNVNPSLGYIKLMEEMMGLDDVAIDKRDDEYHNWRGCLDKITRDETQLTSLAEAVNQRLGSLPEKYRAALAIRYNLNEISQKCNAYYVVAEKLPNSRVGNYGVSPQHARQIVAIAHRILRNSIMNEPLYGFRIDNFKKTS